MNIKIENIGNIMPADVREKIRIKSLGKNNASWKGHQVSKGGLHNWVKMHLGRPLSCQFCGKIGTIVNGVWTIQYANIDHQYKRNLKDWLTLCIKCHYKYDKEHNPRRRSKLK